MPKCNFCQSELTHIVVDLGHQTPSNSFLTKEQLLEPEVYYPLATYVCDNCWLMQVPETKMAKDIFSEQYPYFSSESPSNVSHAKEYVDMIVDRFKPKRVLEIGSNDGYMLQWFKENVSIRGIEPSENCAKVAENKNIPTDVDFFGVDYAKDWEVSFDLICGINVLAHQPDINDFVEGLIIALAPDGIITMEFPHLFRTIEGTQFDQIYHEHFSYFSLTTIDKIFRKHGLEIFDVDELPEHGGSLRIYAQHTGQGKHAIENSVYELIPLEEIMGIKELGYYQDFGSRVKLIKHEFMDWIYTTKSCGETVVAYGAAAKANTFLNYCGIVPDLIPYIVDRSSHKQGLYCPGSHIPVVGEEIIRAWRPDYVLITAWNLKNEIMKQLEYIREWKGKFVIAIPALEIM